MEKQTRFVDSKGRATLFRDFAGSRVTIERVNANELRIRKVRERKPKYALDEMVQQITAKNRHKEIDAGPPAGGEVW